MCENERGFDEISNCEKSIYLFRVDSTLWQGVLLHFVSVKSATLLVSTCFNRRIKWFAFLEYFAYDSSDKHRDYLIRRAYKSNKMHRNERRWKRGRKTAVCKKRVSSVKCAVILFLWRYLLQIAIILRALANFMPATKLSFLSNMTYPHFITNFFYNPIKLVLRCHIISIIDA